MFKLHTSRLAVLPLIVLLSGLGDAITIRISDGLTQYFVPDERARMHSAVLELEMMALPDVTDFFLPSSLGIRDETLGLIVGFMTNVSLTQVEDACQWVRHELGERDVANNALVKSRPPCENSSTNCCQQKAMTGVPSVRWLTRVLTTLELCLTHATTVFTRNASITGYR
ncbi:unnamed protein product (mitochondrion) [Plasmodiophora brassicae]|uniref:Uncharacterized protein n=1 Tax=Plasmodiophora brassicae TaxID=37360 RepID=A0A3P3XYQ4_PLABS|nr:unnamed protein product [Plasmodiophora brassicae]